MKEKITGATLGIIMVIQFALHYLGIAGILLGIIAFLFKNYVRGKELIIGGIILIVLKFIIGFIFIGVLGLATKGDKQLEKQGK